MFNIVSILLWVLLILVVVPVLAYFVVKFGTYAFFKARELANKHKETEK